MKNIALITGASTGIGRELSRIHAEKGGDLIIVARSKEKLNYLKKELEDKYSVEVMVLGRDLSLSGAGLDLYSVIKEANIEIDYLINNAGFGGLGKFYKRNLIDDLAMINLNIVALTELTRLFLSDMVIRNKGKILNVSSTASFIPGPHQAVYYASKAYVTSFSNAIAEELHDTSITVTALLPGPTETEFGKVSGMDKTKMFKKTASARSVAVDGYEAMMAGKLNIVSGVTFVQRMMFWLIPFLPKKILLKEIRKMQEG